MMELRVPPTVILYGAVSHHRKNSSGVQRATTDMGLIRVAASEHNLHHEPH